MSFEAFFRWRPASETPAEPKEAGRLEHKDFLIIATPYSEGGQYQVCASFPRRSMALNTLVRADRCPGIEDAASISLNKGRQIG